MRSKETNLGFVGLKTESGGTKNEAKSFPIVDFTRWQPTDTGRKEEQNLAQSRV